MSNLKYWLWLSNRKGIAGQIGMRVLNHFGSPERVYFSDLEEYRMIDGLSELAVRSLADKSMDGADRILGDCDRLGIQLLTMQDAGGTVKSLQRGDTAITYIADTRLYIDNAVTALAAGMLNA